ncbi:saccharopine dehydrogenase C-terminal domain-containing protein [Bacteroidota bacterium]
MNKILMLGAGLVAKPMVDYLLKNENFFITIADIEKSKAVSLIGNKTNADAIDLDVNDKDSVLSLIKKSDIVISLLPYTFHAGVAELCLKAKKHMVTASYVSPAMKALDEKAKSSGILFLNEIGLDPGIDHMSAIKIIHEVEENGGKIVSFESICGGLPAPEANDNPFGYKFSWSPRGVVMAGRNAAHYLKEGQEVIIEGKDLFLNHGQKEVEGLGMMEVYPNRDSMLYKDIYGLHDAETIFRGTFRNPGWCETILCLSRLNYLDDAPRPDLKNKTFAEVSAFLVGTEDIKNIKSIVADKMKLALDSHVISKLEWLGLFSDDVIDADPVTLLDILANRMSDKMPYKPGERDMIVLQHDFIAEYPDKKERIISLLIVYGIPNGDSSMARMVSLPAAIAVKLILEDKIKLSGVQIPNLPEIYIPVLQELEELNITFKDTVTVLQ